MSRFPLLKMVLGNTYVLSAIYLGVGLLTELLHRFFPSDLLDRVSFALDALPARALQIVGLLGVVRESYLRGQLNQPELRVVFALTTMAVIFLLAFLLGSILSGIQYLASRKTSA